MWANKHLLWLNLDMARALAFGRLVVAWGTLAAFILVGEAWLADLASMVKSTGFVLVNCGDILVRLRRVLSRPTIFPSCSVSPSVLSS